MSNIKNKCNNDQKIINEIRDELNKIENYTPQQKSDFFKKYEIDIMPKDIENIDNDCGYLVANLSTNKIEIPENCDIMIKKVCSDFIDDNKKYDECKKKMRPKILNISQINNVTVSNNCHFNNYIDKIKNNKSEQANNLIIALQQKMNNRVNTIQCDKLNVNLTENKYRDIQNKCVAGTIVDNSNYLKICYGNKIIQENIFDVYNDCIIENGLYNSGSQNITPDIQNVTPDIQNATPDYYNNNQDTQTTYFGKYILYGMVCMIICICLILMLIIFYYVYNQKYKK